MSDDGTNNMVANSAESPSLETIPQAARRRFTARQRISTAIGIAGFSALSVYSGAGDTAASDHDKVEPGGELVFEVAGNPGDVAFVNLTNVGAENFGHGRLLSGDANPPESDQSSNVNFRPGSVDPNVGLAPVASDGTVKYENGTPPGSGVHLIADHLFTIDGGVVTLAQPSGTPLRKVDTRIGLGGAAIGPGEIRCFDVAGELGDAAVVNLTPIQASSNGHGRLVGSDVQLSPSDESSNANYSPGSIDPNLAFAPIGEDGVCYENSALATINLVADHLATIDGEVVTWAQPSSTPLRKVDTRRGIGGQDIAPGESRAFGVAGLEDDLAVVNLTPVLAQAPGHGRLLSSDANPPASDESSNVNYAPGTVDPNVAFAPIGPDGKVKYQNGNTTGARIGLVADHLATIDGDVVTLAQASGTPLRKVDTRNGLGVDDGGNNEPNPDALCLYHYTVIGGIVPNLILDEIPGQCGYEIEPDGTKCWYSLTIIAGSYYSIDGSCGWKRL